MDVLLSLPLASYFLAPGLTSWSTSLNLLFFYMTWTTLVLSHGPLKIELVGVTVLRLLLGIAPSLLFLLFDVGLPSLAESIKFGGAAALPPRDARYLTTTALLALLNLSLAAGLETVFSLGWVALFREPIFKTTSTLPLPWQILKHVVLLISAREFATYYIHRYVLHSNNRLPARLHMSHAHARRAPPFSLALYADHPLPFLLHRIVPILLPALLLRPHLLTYLLFVGLSTGEETLAASGYSVIPGIIMGGIARRTAIHYAGRGTGNFGAWGLLDWISGTSQGKDVVEDMKDEAQKHRVKERSARAVANGTNMVQQGLEGFKGRRSGRQRNKRSSESEY